MKVHKSNKKIFLVLISILILIFSAMPSLSAFGIEQKPIEKSNESVSYEDYYRSNSIYWGNLVDIFDNPNFNEEEYRAKTIATVGSEQVWQRTASSKTFVKDENKVTMRIYSGDVHYKTTTGNWQEYNLEITEYNSIPLGADMKYEHASEDNTIRSYFRNSYTMPGTVLTGVGDDLVTWQPITMSYIDKSNNEFEISEAQPSKAVIGHNKILYPGSYPNAADIFTIKQNELKHEIILDTLPPLSKSPNPIEIESHTITGFLTHSPDLKLYVAGETTPIKYKITTDKPLEFRSEKDTNILRLPTPVAYEFNDNSDKIICKYTVEPMEGGIKLSIQTPYYWLAEPERNFPIVIDPTIVAQQHFIIQPGESKSQDTFIGPDPIDDDNYGKDGALRVGGENFDYRTLIKFDLSTLPASDVEFDTAHLILNFDDISGGYDGSSQSIAVHEIQEAWVEGTGVKNNADTNDGATWNTKDGSTSWSGGAGGTYYTNIDNKTNVSSPGEYPFLLERLVRKWRQTPSQNFGLIVKYRDPSSALNSYKDIRSSSYSIIDHRPKLDVLFYNDPPKQTGPAKFTWEEDTEDPTIIMIEDILYDPNQHQLYVTMWNGTGWGYSYKCSVFNATLEGEGTSSLPWKCIIELKPNAHGSTKLKFNATDRINYKEAEITVEILSINDAPILHAIGDQEAIEEQYLYVPLKVTEVEGQFVTWQTNVSDHTQPNYMPNLFIDPDPKDNYKSTLVFRPENFDVPYVYVNISVYDVVHQPPGTISIDWEHIRISVENVNDEPRFIKIADTPRPQEDEMILTATQDSTKLFYIQAYDDDLINGDDLRFESDAYFLDNFNLTERSGLDVPLEYRAINTEVAEVEWTPRNEHVGEYVVNITVNDTSFTTDTIKLIFKVNNRNDPPEIDKITKSTPSNGLSYTNRDYINLSVDADDPDLHIPDSNEKLNVTWYSNISKLLGYGPNLKNVQLKAGYHNIEIQIVDSEGAKYIENMLLTVEKAITLQKYAGQAYEDNSDFDDVEYSYNDKSKKFSISQGRYEEVDVINLTSYFDDGKIIIDLIFSADITLAKDFLIRIFFVTPQHKEPTQNYKVSYTSGFLQKGLYQPSDNITYGYFTQNDGTVSGGLFQVSYPLADLELGEGPNNFNPLKADFKIFATVRWLEVEYFKDYKVENYRYDSIGWGAAYAPQPVKGPDGGEEEFDYTLAIGAGVAIIIIILCVILFIIMRKKKTQKKTVIDFSQAGAPSYTTPKPGEVQHMFMTPFERQFQQKPPGGPGMGMGGQQMQMPMQQPQITPGIPQPAAPPPTRPGQMPKK